MDTRTATRTSVAVGAALGGAALFNRWSAARAEQDYPPTGEFLEVGNVRLHYLDRGEGPPIVLLHGSGSLIEDMTVSGLVDRLAENHRVVAFDRPGYGHSNRPRGRHWTPEAQAALFVEAMESLGVERPLVFGHSWGTLPALAWALDHPERVSGLVLAAGYYFATPRPDTIPTAIAASPLLGDLYTQTIAPLQTRLTGPLGFRMVFSPDATPDRFIEHMPFRLMLRPSQLHATAADSAQMPLAAARLQKRYEELTLPVTIIWGDGDKLVAQDKQSEQLAREVAHATAVRLPETGHMVHWVALDDVVAAIEATAV